MGTSSWESLSGPVLETEDPPVEAPRTRELGAAVTDDFFSAVGLQDLVKASKRGPGKSPGAPPLAGGGDAPPMASSPAEPEAEPVDLKPLLTAAIRTLDAFTSASLGVTTEEPKELEDVVAMLEPLAQYYAKGTASLTALWITAGLGLASYALTKYAKYQQNRPEPIPDVATPATTPGVPVPSRFTSTVER